MNLLPVVYTPKSVYTAHTPIIVPVLVVAVRAGAIAMLEWGSLRFVENAPDAVWIATIVFAVAVLAVLQTKDWLDFRGKWYFRVSLGCLLAAWVAVSAYGYWAYPPHEKITSTLPTADEIAAAIARNLPKAPTPATPTPSPSTSVNDQALNQMRIERDNLIKERDALKAAIPPVSTYLHLDDAKRWQIAKTMTDGAPAGGCKISQAIMPNDGSGDYQKLIGVWGEIQQPLFYAGWRFNQVPRTFFPPGISIYAGTGNSSPPFYCASRLKDLLDGLHVRPTHFYANETLPALDSCDKECVEVVLGRLESP